MSQKHFLTHCLGAMIVAACLGPAAQAVSIKIDGLNTMTMMNNAAGMTTLNFPEMKHAGDSNWDISAGSVILDIVPGPNGTTSSATLTLTGADDKPLVFTYDPGGRSGNNSVSIDVSSGAFGPIKPAFDSASLDGTYASSTGAMLAVGPTLVAKAFGAGTFGTIGALGKAPGNFKGSVPQVPDKTPPVTSLSFIFSFTWGSGQPAGDTVSLPKSAVDMSQTPEPATVWLFVAGLAALAGCNLQRRKRASKRGQRRDL